MIKQILKQFFGKSEHENAEKLIRLAFIEGKIDEDQIKFINKNIKGIIISKSGLHIDENKIARIKMSLPTNNYQKFKLIHYLTQTFAQSNAMNEDGKQILSQVLTVLHNERSRVNELIESVSSNINFGLSLGEAYSRLGYLLKPRQVNFN